MSYSEVKLYKRSNCMLILTVIMSYSAGKLLKRSNCMSILTVIMSYGEGKLLKLVTVCHFNCHNEL